MAGIELLQEGGPAALTLRRAAARAKVSHAAPAWHFDGLPGLLTAIAAHAFRIFKDEMVKARDALPATPFERLAGICRGYMSFAEDNGGLFHVMFVAAEVERSDPDFAEAANAAYQILSEACAPYADPARPEQTEVAVWSLVHGYVQLGFASPASVARHQKDPLDFDAMLRQLVGSP